MASLRDRNPGGVGKPSPNRAVPEFNYSGSPQKLVFCGVKVICTQPETRRSIHGQGEAALTGRGGPNLPALKSRGMTCGSRRNCSRAWR